VPVLAGPFLRTGFFLPLLPILAFWLKPPGFLLHFADRSAPGLRPMLGYLERLPQDFDKYALLWFLVGCLYLWPGLTRRSFRLSRLAALAINCGLWSLFWHHGLAFGEHLQLWLIPLALIVLASEQINREHLSREQAVGLRYLGLVMIYVSSTADLFLAGLGN